MQSWQRALPTEKQSDRQLALPNKTLRTDEWENWPY
jgi:hypothetical protein